MFGYLGLISAVFSGSRTAAGNQAYWIPCSFQGKKGRKNERTGIFHTENIFVLKYNSVHTGSRRGSKRVFRLGSRRVSEVGPNVVHIEGPDWGEGSPKGVGGRVKFCTNPLKHP